MGARMKAPVRLRLIENRIVAAPPDVEAARRTGIEYGRSGIANPPRWIMFSTSEEWIAFGRGWLYGWRREGRRIWLDSVGHPDVKRSRKAEGAGGVRESLPAANQK